MNINEVISQLHIERDQLNAAIDALERLLTLEPAGEGRIPHRRRRKTMSAKAREEVSERMKRYWKSRRDSEKNEAHPMYAALAS